jgi:hypothetical protein
MTSSGLCTPSWGSVRAVVIWFPCKCEALTAACLQRLFSGDVPVSEMLGFGPSLSEHCEPRAEPHIDPMGDGALASVPRGEIRVCKTVADRIRIAIPSPIVLPNFVT